MRVSDPCTYDASNTKISDHLPLWAEFKVNELTQELNATVKRV